MRVIGTELSALTLNVRKLGKSILVVELVSLISLSADTLAGISSISNRTSAINVFLIIYLLQL
jgi:hypothetical protein